MIGFPFKRLKVVSKPHLLFSIGINTFWMFRNRGSMSTVICVVAAKLEVISDVLHGSKIFTVSVSYSLALRSAL